MGKKQHQSDKLYLTCKEWTEVFGGKQAAIGGDPSKEFKRLAFDHCALSLQPFQTPMCTKEGVVYDLVSIVPFIKKYHVDPANGQPLSAKDLIRLNFFKNAEGKYHCPVTFKIFNENTHIVAISTSGNVYSMEAIQKLNIETKNWTDLMTSEPFTRKDIIHVQDPQHLEKFNMTNFYHITHDLKVISEEAERAKSDPSFYLKAANSTAHEAVAELYATQDKWKSKESLESDRMPKTKAAADLEHKASYSTGAVSAAFTSTHMSIKTVNSAASLDNDLVRYKKIKKSGYVQIQTNKGNINIELRCDIAPRTCENFLKHCQSGYYKNTIFHRSIRNFMIQGGDPTGTGTGGASAFEGGRAFADEFRPNLVHEGRGILSMANSGPDTNKSQFFITYRSCKHLDNKHSVFGKVVGGIETLADMEKVETDEKDKPKQEIKILETVIFENPFQELEDREAKAKAAEIAAKKEGPQELTEAKPMQVFRSGVGKYVDPKAIKKVESDGDAAPAPAPAPTQAAFVAKRLKGSSDLKDFSAW